MNTKKIRVRFPFSKYLADELRATVPAHEMSVFVENVLAREIRRRKLREAIKNAFGAWTDENHPELATFEDVNRWVEDGRKGFARDLSID
ncbi:MAG: hypothetical protein HYZ23_04335 [Chloroflexi bacterium]|nr:hypothetical protein [Chloroflexota bacterium]